MEYEFIDNAGGIVIPLPQSYGDCLKLVKSDYFRFFGIIPSLWRILYSLRRVNVGFSFWLRLSAYKKGKSCRFCTFMLKRYRKYGLLIEPETKIGYGLYLGHCMDLVINPAAIIGNNVNLGHFISIGSNEGKGAIIGDNVYVGPNVCIVENVVIGRSSTIGAGAVVVKDIDNDTTVAGVPAHEISRKYPERFIQNKFKCSLW